MTWSRNTSCGHESAKIASIAVPYLQGRFLDLGCGNAKVWPSAIGIDNGGTYGRGEADLCTDIADLSMFSDGSMDAVFSSHALEDFPRERVPEVLAEWGRVLKIGGYLCLYVPSGNLYPHIGEEGCNPAHKWEPMPGDIECILKDGVGAYGWELVESEERGGTNEYSLWIVVRKTLGGWAENVWQRNPGGKKRCLVVRFGAVGDQLQTASILPGLRAQGYHVTYCTTPKGQEIVRHDPHVDEWLIQETDYVPNQQLGAYFESVMERHDRFVNLCESVEASLLAMPGRVNHTWPDDTRRRLMGTVNYLERMHDIAGVPHDWATKFYPTKGEVAAAEAWRARECGDAPVILWAINGSSLAHKLYPFTHVVLRWLMENTPAHVVLTADPNMGRQLQDGILDTLRAAEVEISRIHGIAGQWDIRQSLTFALIADCIIGPETGVLNAVSLEPMAKVVMLSHSSATNLTRDWVNTWTIEPDRAKAPCFPCHRLHADTTYCPRDDDAHSALCAGSIEPNRVYKAIMEAFRGPAVVAEAAD